jgi:hypothetical protein
MEKYKVTATNWETGECREMILDHHPVMTHGMMNEHAADTLNTIAETMGKLTAVMVELAHDPELTTELQQMLHGYARIIAHMGDDITNEMQ